jgi:predicted Zn-dependent protease
MTILLIFKNAIMQKLTILIIIINILAINSINAQELPELGNYSSNMLSTVQEQQLGRKFMRELQTKASINYDPLINDYLNLVGYRLVANTSNHQPHFHFFVVTSSDINSFAGPGGYIGVNSGLILLTKTESELAAVLAHEISHVNQHHMARSIARAKELSLPMLAAMLAAVAVSVTSNSDAAMGAALAALGGGNQDMTSFMRSNEKEADRIGLKTLYRAGFDPMAMPTFFRRMQQDSLSYSNDIPRSLQNHPVTNVRIADAENRAVLYPARKVKSSLNYYLMRARLRVQDSKTGFEIVNYFASQLKNHTYQNLAAAKYGYALALLKNNKTKLAISEINKLLSKTPNDVIYQMDLAKAQLKDKQAQKALKTLQNSLSFYPDYYPLIVQYSQSLLKAKQANKARLFLQKQILDYPNDKILYALLSRAQGESNHLADSYQSRAKLSQLQGDHYLAIVQLQEALKLPKLDSETKAILNAKILDSRLRGNDRAK